MIRKCACLFALVFLVIFSISGVLVGCKDKPKEHPKPTLSDSKKTQPKIKYCPEIKRIVGTHAVGLCNMTFFIMHEKGTAKPFGAELELKYVPNWGDHPAALTGGDVDVSVTPFTNVIAARANGSKIKIISGSGMNGLYCISQEAIKNWESMKGKKLGTFRADTLEITAYDAMEKAGLTTEDIEIVYFNDGFELMHAFANNSVDALTHVEPYATEAVTKYKGNVLSKGQDVWGGNHPDCVLVTTEKMISENRNALKALIAGMFVAEAYIEQHFESAVDMTVGKFYKTDRESILLAGKSQPPMVDIRDKKQFILERSKSLQELGYISTPVDENIFDLSLLEEVIAENPEIFKAVRVKAILPSQN